MPEKKNSIAKSNDFFDAVFQLVRLIPQGRVCNYGTIASFLGSKGSARMVGYAMNASHSEKIKVPAHRVVNRQGLLTGKHHFETPFRMQELLELEGVRVENNKIVDFEKHFWNPADELNWE